MGLIFSMLRNDNQTLGNTTNMEKKEPDEPGVARSEGTTKEEPMGDEGFVTPVPLNGPFKEFFAAWVAAYTATNETYEMLPAVESNQCDCEPASADDSETFIPQRLGHVTNVAAHFGTSYRQPRIRTGRTTPQSQTMTS